jgi:hypothetical protein
MAGLIFRALRVLRVKSGFRKRCFKPLLLFIYSRHFVSIRG